MNMNPRGALRPICHEHESHTDREEESPSGHGPRCYPYFSSHSLRRAARSLRPISESHAPMWRWAQRSDSILGSIGADPEHVHRIFIDETMVNLGGTPRVDLGRVRAGPPRHARLPRSPRGNSIDAYLFIGRPVRKYGGVPICTDGAGWCADACRWAGAERAVHGRPLRNLMERVVQCAKDGTEAFDDPFPVAGAGRGRGGRSSACITGCQRSRPCRTSRPRTGIWGGPR